MRGTLASAFRKTAADTPRSITDQPIGQFETLWRHPWHFVHNQYARSGAVAVHRMRNPIMLELEAMVTVKTHILSDSSRTRVSLSIARISLSIAAYEHSETAQCNAKLSFIEKPILQALPAHLIALATRD